MWTRTLISKQKNNRGERSETSETRNPIEVITQKNLFNKLFVIEIAYKGKVLQRITLNAGFKT